MFEQPTDFQIFLNELEIDTEIISREARHINQPLYDCVKNIYLAIQKINTVSYTMNDQEDYVKTNLLNIMDELKDTIDNWNNNNGIGLIEKNILTKTYNNIRTFYFNY